MTLDAVNGIRSLAPNKNAPEGSADKRQRNSEELGTNAVDRLQLKPVSNFTGAANLSIVSGLQTPAKQPTLPPRSGLDLEAMDGSVLAKDDLFRAANGRWLNSSKIPDDRSSWGAFAELRLQATRDLLAIVKDISSTTQVPGSNERKLTDFHTAFMNTKRLNTLGITPLQDHLATIDKVATRDDVYALWGRNSTMNVKNPVGMYVGQDRMEPEYNTALIDQSGTTFPTRKYYEDPGEKFANIRAEFGKYVAYVMQRAGVQSPDAAQRIIAFETRLSQAQWTPVQQRDAVASYNAFDDDGLKELAPAIPWSLIAAQVGMDAPKKWVVDAPSYFTELNRIVEETSLDDLKLYSKFHLLNTFSKFMDEDFSEKRFALFGTALYGAKAQAPRAERSISAMSANFRDALGEAYVAKHYSPATKARVEAMVGNLRTAFRGAIEGNTWMAAATKIQALDKLSRFTVKVGHPEEWIDYSDVEVTPNDLIGSVINAQHAHTRRNSAQLGKAADRGEWHMGPHDVNAYFNPPMNEIVFPAAIAQAPFFDADADDAVNYGGLGAVIGHEYSHGYDDQGRKYDGSGRLRDWWTTADADNYSAKAKNIIAQFSAYAPFEDAHVNGDLTQGENIADLAGLTMAYRAYKLSLDGKPSPIIEGMTGEQRFFLSFAQIYQVKRREAAQRAQLEGDPHSPAKYRVGGTVGNMGEFYDAFNVREGDGMYLAPEKRTSIW